MSTRNSVIPILELSSPAIPTRLVQLEGDLIRIGRDPTSEIALNFKQVSWNHARILRGDDGGYLVEDVGSYNSTYLDGRRLTPRVPIRLVDNNRIRICDVTLIFRSEAVSIRETHGELTTILGSLEDVSSLSLPSRPERANAVLRAVLEINRILGGTADLNVALSQALHELFVIFSQADRGFILTREPDSRLSPRATRFSPAARDSLTLSKTVLNHVLREGKALLISADDSMSTSISTESLNEAGIRTAICVPVFGRQAAPIGIIQLDTKVQPGTFTQEDLELLAAVAVPIGVVIENHRLLHDRAALSAAGEVQSGLLPKHPPKLSGYTFWERYQPALEVGGDYYDYIPVETEPGCEFDDESADDHRQMNTCFNWAVVVGDVVGKGMPAALLMANLCAEVRHLVRSGTPPEEIVGRVNRQIYDAALPGRFVTFVITILDAKENRLTVVNAGHLAPLIRRAGGSLETIGEAEADIPLGIERRRVYKSARTDLSPGDVVILFT
ncbi:MAG: SpoIIE family protein phosphatase, partial [Isosphaeraceae bacterium]